MTFAEAMREVQRMRGESARPVLSVELSERLVGFGVLSARELERVFSVKLVLPGRGTETESAQKAGFNFYFPSASGASVS